MKKLEDLTRRINELHAQGIAVLSSRRINQYGPDTVDAGRMAGFRAAGLSFLHGTFSSSHPHYAEFDKVSKTSFESNAKQAIAVLEAVLSEVEGGWLVSVKALVAAELFSDFLEMAEHLLDAGYKDAAAVMIGSVLEEHLRQLCPSYGVDVAEQRGGDEVPKKADRLNADLAKALAYSKLDQKQITGWLDLRNNAAHGKYAAYNQDQVKLMRAGVLEFMTRVSR